MSSNHILESCKTWKKALDNHGQLVAQSRKSGKASDNGNRVHCDDRSKIDLDNNKEEIGTAGLFHEQCITSRHPRHWCIVFSFALCVLIILPIVFTQVQEKSFSHRDMQYLKSHNSRRKEWHERYNTSYVPLMWDHSLKVGAKVWAKTLLASCGEGMYHDPGNSEYGENVAANQGNGDWGVLMAPDQIIARFVEKEETMQPPENGHLTQVLWRTTKYVGCADASRRMAKGKFCHTQVCRYAPTGNCNLKKYESDQPDWWLEPMLLEEGELCGPECPPNGCH